VNRFFSPRRAVAALVAVAIVGFTHGASAKEPVPFKGVADAVVTGAEPGPDGLYLTLTATGEAAQLGEFTRVEHIVIRGDGTIEGTVVFVAANGDRLYADIDGFAVPTGAIGTYTFAGGTGRFASATGTAAFEADTTDEILVTFAGTIAY
jgi:hypothetical protein